MKQRSCLHRRPGRVAAPTRVTKNAWPYHSDESRRLPLRAMLSFGVTPLRAAFSLLLGVSACGGSAPSARQGLAYPEPSGPTRAPLPALLGPAPGVAARNPAPDAVPNA